MSGFFPLPSEWKYTTVKRKLLRQLIIFRTANVFLLICSFILTAVYAYKILSFSVEEQCEEVFYELLSE